MLDKLKKLVDQAKEKAAPLAEQAAHKATELASEAREKAGPLAEQAKERAVDLAGKAAPAVSQGVDKAAERLDKATGGRYSSQLDKVQDVVHDTASKVAASAGGPSGQAEDATTQASGESAETTFITGEARPPFPSADQAETPLESAEAKPPVATEAEDTTLLSGEARPPFPSADQAETPVESAEPRPPMPSAEGPVGPPVASEGSTESDASS